MEKRPSTVEELVAGLDSRRRELVEEVRAIVRKSLPEAVESLKWGQPVYAFKGTNVICIMIYDDHINYGLFMGARLRSKRLEGTGKGLRHIKIRTKDDVDEREFARLARDAANLT